MKQISEKDFFKVLERTGWSLTRIRGSHLIYTMEGRIERISVPVHGNKPLKMGLLKAVMKMASVDESEL